MAEVTPPGAFRKMNSDNNVCSTLTSNIMNMIMIMIAVRQVQIYAGSCT